MLCYIILHIIFIAQWSKSQLIFDQEELVEMLSDPQRLGYIKSNKVRDVMLEVDRKDYVHKNPYDDVPVSVGYGATFATASVDAVSLESLNNRLKRGNVALDVGSGTGYMSVLMALMVGKTGRVVAIDHIPELVNRSIQNVMKDKPELLESGRLTFLVGDARNGTPNYGPYDAIHVGAVIMEDERLPPALVELLKQDGRMVIPVNRDIPGENFNELMIVEKDEDGSVLKSFNGIYYEHMCEFLTDKQTQIKRNLRPDM